MLELQPFTGHVVATGHAARVVAPPYDALDPAAREALVAGDPDSYLGALPPAATGGVTAELDAALDRAAVHLGRLLTTGRYRPVTKPSLGVLALGTGPDRAVGIVGDLPAQAYVSAEVRPHERVREDRVAELARYLEVVGVASSPVAITQRPHADVTTATAPVLTRTPDVAFRDDDAVDVAYWVVDDPAAVARLTAAVAAAGPGYLADGHHRAAAAARHAAAVGATADAPAGRVLTAVLPSDHLSVLPFHRRLDGVVPTPTGEAEVAEVVDRLRRVGTEVVPLAGPQLPGAAGRTHLVVGGRWFAVTLPRPTGEDPIETLDVRRVERVVVPALDPTGAAVTAGRLVPVASPLGLGALDAAGAVGVALHPPTIDDVLAIADAGAVVPPKTTYVTPKLRSGLVVTPRSSPAAAAYASR